MKKRILLTILAGLLVFCSTACGKTSSDNDVYNILWYNTFNEGDDADLVFEEASKITQEKIGATITNIFIQDADYAEKIKMLIAANEPMDLLWMTRSTGFTTLAAQKALYPLNELLASDGQDILSQIPEQVFEATTHDGKIYAVPTLKDWPHEQVIRYNVSMAEKYNF